MGGGAGGEAESEVTNKGETEGVLGVKEEEEECKEAADTTLASRKLHFLKAIHLCAARCCCAHNWRVGQIAGR